MDRWLHKSAESAVEGPPLPPSLENIVFDDDAIWGDLCDTELWKPLQDAVKRVMRIVHSPATMRESALSVGEWNMAHLPVVMQVQPLYYLLMARQLSEYMQGQAWEEPLASLLHGLDVAVAGAVETGRQLATEINAESIQDDTPDDPWTTDARYDASIPEWGRGYAYVLYRRYAAELQCVLDLLWAVCEEANSADEG